LLQETLLDHGIGGALTNLKQHGVFPSEIGIDLLVIAAHVYAADTHLARRTVSGFVDTRDSPCRPGQRYGKVGHRVFHFEKGT
jgi:hypothetical protein